MFLKGVDVDLETEDDLLRWIGSVKGAVSVSTRMLLRKAQPAPFSQEHRTKAELSTSN